MRFLYALMKLVSLLGSVFAAFLIYEIWIFLSGGTMPFDLIGPSMDGYPILDYMVAGLAVFFTLASFVFSTAETRSWKNLLFGLPLAIVNNWLARSWWQMELGKYDIYLVSILMTVVFLIDIFASILFINMPFRTPLEIDDGSKIDLSAEALA